ncbi:uncharacterized protein BO97DRAFT_415650 [Aspergillus homomorphus CBS 101889]|uniref:Uncharacterized protein n=1 Tax=Aspergillus homomorphus (strain CBS 101889) TaxID=1450537 RepID=A0A395HSR2_ASPHC|nr:hypothetical protein BO97DRAFT_415650 [Aspergillus homomorphus CBS 101889]RAL10867.1 hypothetical protein BO97DRAFT_415650 [Aspergillus homomorphus CBS 101889]
MSHMMGHTQERPIQEIGSFVVVVVVVVTPPGRRTTSQRHPPCLILIVQPNGAQSKLVRRTQDKRIANKVGRILARFPWLSLAWPTSGFGWPCAADVSHGKKWAR